MAGIMWSKQRAAALLMAVSMGVATVNGAYLIEIDTDGLDDGIITFNSDFSFGGDTTAANQSIAGTAVGLTGGDSIYGGNGSAELDTYVYTYSPETQADNLALVAGASLGGGNVATGATGEDAGRYIVYATWPNTANVAGGLTNYLVEIPGASVSFAVDQNSIGGVWVKVGEIDYTSGPITVTQTCTTNAAVSMRAAGVLFELDAPPPGPIPPYTGPPGAVTFEHGGSQLFGVAFERNRVEAQSKHFSVLSSTDMAEWSTSDLKLVSVTDIDADHELVTFHSMAPMSALPAQYLKVQPMPKMPLGAKYCAMTFDDGPHATNTPALLDLLAERNIRATFYLVGNRVPAHASIVRRMVNEGHEIGNHSYTHTDLITLTDEEVIDEIASCRDEIMAAATVETATIRPPYGSYRDGPRDLSELFMSEFGYPNVLWDVDPRDWDSAVSDQQVINEILTKTDHGDRVLCHDIHARTIAVMPTVLDGLLAQGFSFVTISELLVLQAN